MSQTGLPQLTVPQVQLGRSGLRVSRLCLGTMMFGDQTDEPTARGIIHRARDQGVNFIDTADVYAQGRSEEIVGRAIRNERDRWVLATKFGSGAGASLAGGASSSRHYVLHAVERSLHRLGTDHIDLLYLHRDDPNTPLAETLRALADLVRQGKIRYFGVSNFRAWRVAEVAQLCDAMGLDRPAASQPLYNAMNRMAELEHLPACAHHGVGVVPYSPLARGVLTGKYAAMDAAPEGTRAARKDTRLMQTEWRAESIAMAHRLAEHAAERGVRPSHLAINWVLNNALVNALIAGPRTQEQWEDYAAALAMPYTAEDEALVDSLVRAGHPSTPGYTDPVYPVLGRVPRVAAASVKNGLAWPVSRIPA